MFMQSCRCQLSGSHTFGRGFLGGTFTLADAGHWEEALGLCDLVAHIRVRLLCCLQLLQAHHTVCHHIVTFTWRFVVVSACKCQSEAVQLGFHFHGGLRLCSHVLLLPAALSTKGATQSPCRSPCGVLITPQSPTLWYSALLIGFSGHTLRRRLQRRTRARAAGSSVESWLSWRTCVSSSRVRGIIAPTIHRRHRSFPRCRYLRTRPGSPF